MQAGVGPHHGDRPSHRSSSVAPRPAATTETPETDDTATTGYPRNQTLHTLFLRQVKTRPNAPAARLDDDVLSYVELDRAANALALRLAKTGVKPGDVIGLVTHRSLQSVIAMVAVLKAGAAYAPLDPQYPIERLAFMLEDAEATAVLVHDDHRAKVTTLPAFKGTVVAFDDPMDLAARAYAPPNDGGVTGADRAYVIYTSGSTGRPKGVECTHRGLVRMGFAKNSQDVAPGTVTLHVTSLSFDVSQYEFWVTLLNGGCLAILPDATPALDHIAHAIRRYDVTFACLSTGLFHLMVDHRLDGLKPLRRIMVGGDVMSPSHVAKAAAALTNTQLINGYGPTENAVFTTRFDLPREGWTDGAIPIGRGLEHTTTHILDKDLRPVAPGEIGQLCSGGDGVAIGYLNRPELTAEKFPPDPFSNKVGARLYLTGDLVRMRPDGLIEFHGRADRQVKINGKRIELDEIENGLREDPDLADAAVTIHDAGGEAKRITAYIKPQNTTPERERGALGQIIIGRFKGRFPAHMIPVDVVVLDAFPLTSAGKVDRAKLPPPAARTRHSAPANAPGTKFYLLESKLESAIADIWRRVLKIEHVGRNDSFFDLGGTSLLLVKVHAQIQDLLDSSVELITLFDRTTVRDLAVALSAAPDESAERDTAKARASRADKRTEALARARKIKTKHNS